MRSPTTADSRCSWRRAAEPCSALDSSAAAVAADAATTRARNGLTNVEVREANVFDELRELEIAGERFDTIVLDPPAFAKNKAAVERAIAGYKEINLRALRLLEPGGHLVTCSCSYNVDEALFIDGRLDSRRRRARRPWRWSRSACRRATIPCCLACPRRTT